MFKTNTQAVLEMDGKNGSPFGWVGTYEGEVHADGLPHGLGKMSWSGDHWLAGTVRLRCCFVND